MKKTRLILIGMLALVAVIALGSVSATLAAPSGGEKNVTLDGITFNIPEGYKIMDNYTENNLKVPLDDGVEYIFNERGYNNSEGKEFMVTVSTFLNESDYKIPQLTAYMMGNEKTVNGVKGYMSGSDKRFTIFAYVVDGGKLVMISAEEPALFDKIVTG
jgi:hypothetical protein